MSRHARDPGLPGWLIDEVGAAPDASVLELVDHLLDKGCLLHGELMLGLAGVDLVYVELSALLCSAERLLGFSGSAGEHPTDAE